MKSFKRLLLPMCAIALSSIAHAEEIEIEGLLVLKSDETQGLAVTKQGEKYLIQDPETGFKIQGVLEGLVLKTDKGDITFSKDGKSARLGGDEFTLIPKDEMEDYLAKKKPEMDRSKCVTNIKQVQQSMRGEAAMKDMEVGDPLEKSFIKTFMAMPECPSGGTYTFKDKVTKKGVLYCTCSHAKDKGHEPEDHSDW